MALVSKHLTKQEFGRRLYSLMLAQGWTQSELARQADLPRDSISVYVRGRSLPTPTSLAKLAQAFNMQSEELLPNLIDGAIDEDTPAFEMKVSTNAQNIAWVRVNRAVTLKTALKIAELLESDDALRKENP
jgi:transcriptional regulator with XRE-family HTH domain